MFHWGTYWTIKQFVGDTFVELNFCRQLDQGNVVGESARVPVWMEVGVGGLDDNSVGLTGLGDIVASGVNFPAENIFDFY